MTTRFLPSGLAMALCLGLRITEAADNDPKPGASAEGALPALFESVDPELSGLKFVHRLDENALQAYLYNSPYACGGVSVGDLDGDRLPDVVLVSGVDENALFLNRGGITFEKSPASAALADRGVWSVGSALADVDGDADLDIYVCNYDGANRLWLNDGRGKFTEVAARAGVDVSGPSHSAYFGDLDHDGDLDLFLVTNRLHSPTGRPREAATETGPDGRPKVKDKFAAYFEVITLPDGVNDEPLAPAAGSTPGGTPAAEGMRRQFLLEYGHPDRLFRNDGPGPDGVPQFKEVTRGSGIEGVSGHGLSALLWDINGDGLTDIYVANDYSDPDRLWLNLGASEDGGFRFRDATDEFVPYTTWSSMGSDLADINGDGLLDFMVADMAATTHFKAKTTMGAMEGYRRWVLENGWPRQAMRNMLYVATPAGRFLETAFQSGVARTDWTWAVRFGDFDLDGRPDLFITNGVARSFSDSDIPVTPVMVTGHNEWEFYKDTPPMRERNLAFRNEGDLRFADVSRAWGLDPESMSYGAASGDFDADGDIDLIVCNLTENVSLFRNRAADNRKAHWLEVRLEGTKNKLGLGAVVIARLDTGAPLIGLMNPYTGFLGGNEPVIHFGLGPAARVASLEVRWPDGAVQRLGPQPADRVVTVRQSPSADAPSSTVAAKSGTPQKNRAPSGRPEASGLAGKPAPARTRFTEVAERVGLVHQHREAPFDDYRREFLLPGKLSQFGPGLAVSDVNGDGLDDLFVGGAAGQAGTLFVHQKDHSFTPLADGPWAAHAASEDMGALFFDADRDGDLDLYVASGSNEWDQGDPLYADRLYLNETKSSGPVTFAAAPAPSLPDIRQSGSCVVGADFDRDGDVDVFVGARSVPGQYLLIPESTLLLNESTRPGQIAFSDSTDTLAPGLKLAGMVTAALWSDADGDGWLDLLVVSDWGPVRLFHNHQGRLIEATESAGLAGRLGWWNSLAGADFDGDGDIDYLVLNAGLNTKYGHPTEKKPTLLYRGDMDENGVSDLIEAKTAGDGELLPVRGRSCSSLAMPFLKDKFSTYRAFALANLEGIYTDDRLARSRRATANDLASGCLINDSKPGRPGFTWYELPALTQLSPGFGAVAADIFGEGLPCAALAQNLNSREPETGLWRGGIGVVLRFNGHAAHAKGAGWSEEPPGQSGFVVPGDGKGLALADLDADGWPDLVATQNNDRLLAFLNHPPAGSTMVTVRLAGPPGNPACLGARITLRQGDSRLLTTEISGGSGYLSQSAPTLNFPRPKGQPTPTLEVQWPSGQRSLSPLNDVRHAITLTQPTP